MKLALEILRCELKIEWRNSTGPVCAVLFSFLALLTQALSLPDRLSGDVSVAMAVFYVSVCFASILSENSRISRERKTGLPSLFSLSPAPSGDIFIAKTASIFFLIAFVEICLFPFLIIFFGLPVDARWVRVLALILAANVALAGLMALFGAGTSSWKGIGQTLALPVMLLPLALPILATASIGSAHVFLNQPAAPYLKLLIAADLVILTAGALSYGKLLGKS